jgi:hypothetical protein
MLENICVDGGRVGALSGPIGRRRRVKGKGGLIENCFPPGGRGERTGVQVTNRRHS